MRPAKKIERTNRSGKNVLYHAHTNAFVFMGAQAIHNVFGYCGAMFAIDPGGVV